MGRAHDPTCNGAMMPTARTTRPWYILTVAIDQVLDQIDQLLSAEDPSTVNTSMRLPEAIREAAALAVERLGIATSTTALTASALRSVLETAVMEAALEHHFEQHPDTRPSLADVALALAAQDGSPLADKRDVVERAADEVLTRHPDADADDVLLWAEAQQAMATSA